MIYNIQFLRFIAVLMCFYPSFLVLKKQFLFPQKPHFLEMGEVKIILKLVRFNLV
jgi:hypothetical protein